MDDYEDYDEFDFLDDEDEQEYRDDIGDDESQYQEDDYIMAQSDYGRVATGIVDLGIITSHSPLIDRVKQEIITNLNQAAYENISDNSKQRAVEYLSYVPVSRLTTIHIPTLTFAIAYFLQYATITEQAVNRHLAKAKALGISHLDGIRYIRMFYALMNVK